MKKSILILIGIFLSIGLYGCDRQVYVERQLEETMDVINTMEIDLNRDRIVDKVQLIHNENDIELKINKTTYMIDETYSQVNNGVSIKDEFELEEINFRDKKFICIARWDYYKDTRKLRYLNIYAYNNNDITRIIDFRGSQYDLKIANVSFKDKSYVLNLYKLLWASTKKLNHFQIDIMRDLLPDKKDITDADYNRLNNYFKNHITNILFKDYNGDGLDDIIFISDVDITGNFREILEPRVFFVNLMGNSVINKIKIRNSSEVGDNEILSKYVKGSRVGVCQSKYYNYKRNVYRIDFYGVQSCTDSFNDFIVYRIDNDSAEKIFTSRKINFDYKGSRVNWVIKNNNNIIKIDDYDGDGTEEIYIQTSTITHYSHLLIIKNVNGSWESVFSGWVSDDIQYVDVDGDGIKELISDEVRNDANLAWLVGLKRVNQLQGTQYIHSEELTLKYFKDRVRSAEEKFIQNESHENFANMLNAYSDMGNTQKCKELIQYYSYLVEDETVDYSQYHKSPFADFFKYVLYKSDIYHNYVWSKYKINSDK